MKFKQLTDYFQKLEATPSRNQMTILLAQLLKAATAEESDQICYLALGRLAPAHEAIEFNLAEKMLLRVLAQAYKKDEAVIRKKYQQLGDLGDVAAFCDKREKAKPLSVSQAFARLKTIAVESGTGSVEKKINQMATLLDDLDAQSAKYVVRIPLGKLRLGFSDKTILDALSWMLAGDKSKRAEIEAAYNVRADVGQIAKIVKAKGLSGLKSLKLQVGIPVMPALCQRLPTAEEMIKKMGRVAVEPKFDGTRLQVHFQAGKTTIFTRNLENVTPMFPDLVKALPQAVRAKTAILDGEAIGFDPKTGKFLPFQETIKRKRKYEIKRKAQEVPLKLFCFDILLKDGRDLLGRPFSERRKILSQMLGRNQTIVLTPQVVTDDPEKLRQYHQKQINQGLEGVVIKKWESVYDPGKRGYTWVKFKQEKGKKGGGLADTLDCLVMGYYRGRGKRAAFGIGAFLVGIKKAGKFLTLSKIGTGLTDEQWREMKKRSQRYEVKDQPREYEVDKNLKPSVWLKPGIVVEIEADNITRSPAHTAQYALRFPRLVRFRDDKNSGQTTNLQEVEKLYQLQK